MKPFRFVHAADLHLDSPFRGIRRADEALGRMLARSTFEAFDRLIDLCIERSVDALLVAGDVYDGADRSLRAQLAFQAGMERLHGQGIAAFVAHGNHDPLDGWQAALRMPPRCHRFGPEPEAIPLDPERPEWVTVHGMSFPRRVVSENVTMRFRTTAAAINVGVLHATVGSQPEHDPYAPCSLTDLAATGMDYWALGHVHERQVLRESAPAVVYPGNPQGRHIKEQGERGVYVVELSPGQAPTVEFVPVDVVRWTRAAVDASAAENEQDLLDLCLRQARQAAAAADGRFLLVVLRLEGRSELHDALRRDGFLDDLQDHLNNQMEGTGRRIQVVDVEDHTLASHAEDAAGGQAFAGELLRVAADSTFAAELGAELRELLDHRSVRRHIKAGDFAVEPIVGAGVERALEALRDAPP